MKSSVLSIIFLIALGTGSLAPATAQLLRGEVLLISPQGHAEQAVNTSIVLAESGRSVFTDYDGQFVMGLPQRLAYGDPIYLRVPKKDWRIWKPIEGKHTLSRDLFVTIKLLPVGSETFWTGEFIAYHLEKIVQQAKREVKPAQPTTEMQQVNLGPLIKDWAEAYGFSEGEVRQHIDTWVAEVQEKQENFHALGLAAYAKKDFSQAAELFEKEAATYAGQLKASEEQGTASRDKAIRGYRIAGDTHFSNYEFEKALTDYDHALTFINQTENSELWTDVQLDLAQAYWAIGVRTEGPAVHEHLTRAKEAYSVALILYGALQKREKMATALVGMGNVLRAQGILTRGEAGRLLLAKAGAAFRTALQTYTRDQWPQQWALIQNNLGITLATQGIRTGGEAGKLLLAEAVAIFRAALAVYTREQLPADWAGTQNNLGIALRDQGILMGGEPGRQLLVEATAAFKLALEVRTKDSLAHQWAQTHNNLAEAAFAYGDWNQTVASYQNVLSLYPDYAQAYYTTNAVLHEKLFAYEEAFSLTQRWLRRHPDDLFAQINFALIHFTTGRFGEAEVGLTTLLANPQLHPQSQIALRLIELGTLAAQGNVHNIPSKIQALGTYVERQPAAFRLRWSFEGTKHFIGQHTALASFNTWLLDLIAGFEGETNSRATMLSAIEAANTSFMAAASKVKQDNSP